MKITLKTYFIISIPGCYLLGLQALFYAASGQDIRHNLALMLMFISFSTAIYLCHRWPKTILATQVLSIAKDWTYTICRYWPDGSCELVEEGKTAPGGMIAVDGECIVIYE